jgi:hypothetical protein
LSFFRATLRRSDPCNRILFWLALAEPRSQPLCFFATIGFLPDITEASGSPRFLFNS